MAEKVRFLVSNGQYSRYSLEGALNRIKQLGQKRLDFVPHPPHLWCGHTGYEDTGRLKAALEASGLEIAVLTPPPYRYSITAPDGFQRTATLRYYRYCIALAAEVGADRVVLGAAGACWDLAPGDLLRNAAEMLRDLCGAAQAAGVRLLLAPVMGPDAPLLAESPVLGPAGELAAVLEQVDSPALGVCLDTNVMSAWGDTPEGWFSLLGERTGLVRLCDGNYHGWRAWGEGCLPMERYLETLNRLGYRGEFSLLLPGERYTEEPERPDRRALAAVCGEAAAWR